MYSIDWLTLAQQYPPGSVPDLGDGAFLVIDADGVEERRSARWVHERESHDTSVAIRSSGGLVEFSGNPSRLGRLDNVFGLYWLGALSRVNSLLDARGLPAFSSSILRPAARVLERSKFGVCVSDGCVVRRVDLCRNFATGEKPAGVASLIRSLRQGTWQGKVGRELDWSASWGSRRSRYAKVYAKGPEMRAHAPRGKVLNEWDPEAIEYRERVAGWCEEVGLVRWEVQFGRDGLRALGMRTLGGFDVEQLEQEAENMREKIWPSVGLGGLSEISGALQERGVSARQAAFLQALAYEWASGVDVFSQFEQPTAYRYRKLLRLVGVDIRHGLRDVTALRVQPRVVDLQPAAVPDWYRQAA